VQRSPRRAAGFTLIELMLVVVIIAVLATIAFPTYQNYVRNAQRADGTTALMQVALAQERHRANNPAYAATIGDLVGVAEQSPEGRYDLEIDGAPTATSFRATAEKRDDGGVPDPGCYPLWLEYDAGGIMRGPEGCWRN
jgi:type IV pilus assembly protein PilE